MAECPPTPKQLLAAWLRVSLQSFGGGAATLALIRREFIDKTGWISEQEFLRDWSLCQLAPGINLIALAVLVGRRTGGALGILVGLSALLLPSFAITVALTAAYAKVIHSPIVAAALKGIVPAVAGIGLATAWGMAVPIAKRIRSRGSMEFLGYGTLLVLCILASVYWRPSTVVILLGAGIFGAAFNSLFVKLKRVRT